ncbi:MAG: nucleotide exchange factor GrpE [Actinomycetes bacterium]
MSDQDDSGFSFQDNRRIDPESFEVREPAAPAPEGASVNVDDVFAEIVDGIVVDGEPESADAKVAELTSDLQRVHAEYANYRKRVDRERETTRDQVVGATLAELLPILDDIGRAREHGDLDGAFKSVAETLEATVTRLGVERFGTPGDEFDPTIHEAISHQHSADVTGPTCVSVFQQGYRFKGRVLRPAIVAVADPE